MEKTITVTLADSKNRILLDATRITEVFEQNISEESDDKQTQVGYLYFGASAPSRLAVTEEFKVVVDRINQTRYQ